MPAIITIICLLLTAVAPGNGPGTHSWKVVSVHDGDTVRAIDDANVQHKIRLDGIDAPEIGQPYGTKSKDALAAIVMGKTVVVHDHGKDKYGRTLATLEVAGKIVNAELVAGGWAWHYTRYSKDQTLAAAQLEAQARKRGLWADARPIPPWEWRATAKDRKAVPAGK